MKVYEDRVVPPTPQRIDKRCVGRACDLCGTKADKGGEWITGSYEYDRTEVSVTIKNREGYECADGGDGTECEIDLCPACFRDKLVPWLKEQGANVDYVKWDW
jgi:hypothetical protein